eukprot:TRINITY_DN8142_c1_g1_i1.p1 TRINITY_DN8142_c1_g1~~TRINITY_DN8142_c1_g1_i1.p1  ORF type:complete len:598 (-),score=68.06 TRINITY_DN8142_c1_g1_i1:44-1837(-)
MVNLALCQHLAELEALLPGECITLWPRDVRRQWRISLRRNQPLSGVHDHVTAITLALPQKDTEATHEWLHNLRSKRPDDLAQIFTEMLLLADQTRMPTDTIAEWLGKIPEVKKLDGPEPDTHAKMVAWWHIADWLLLFQLIRDSRARLAVIFEKSIPVALGSFLQPDGRIEFRNQAEYAQSVLRLLTQQSRSQLLNVENYAAAMIFESVSRRLPHDVFSLIISFVCETSEPPKTHQIRELCCVVTDIEKDIKWSAVRPYWRWFREEWRYTVERSDIAAVAAAIECLGRAMVPTAMNDEWWEHGKNLRWSMNVCNARTTPRLAELLVDLVTNMSGDSFSSGKAVERWIGRVEGFRSSCVRYFELPRLRSQAENAFAPQVSELTPILYSPTLSALKTRLLTLERNISWDCVNETFRNLRQNWMETITSATEVHTVTECALLFESFLLERALASEWLSNREGFTDTLRSAPSMQNLRRFLINLGRALHAEPGAIDQVSHDQQEMYGTDSAQDLVLRIREAACTFWWPHRAEFWTSYPPETIAQGKDLLFEIELAIKAEYFRPEWNERRSAWKAALVGGELATAARTLQEFILDSAFTKEQ